MLSWRERHVEFGRINDQIRELKAELDKKSNQLLQLPKNCKHEVIIHYGEEKFTEFAKGKIMWGNFYCPACGCTQLNIERGVPDAESFLLEASGFKSNNPNPSLNLREVLAIYTNEMLKTQEPKGDFLFKTPDELVRHLWLNFGIEVHRVKVELRD